LLRPKSTRNKQADGYIHTDVRKQKQTNTQTRNQINTEQAALEEGTLINGMLISLDD